VLKSRNPKIANGKIEAFSKIHLEERTYTPFLMTGIFWTNFYGVQKVAHTSPFSRGSALLLVRKKSTDKELRS
jgi:hypothetical protein